MDPLSTNPFTVFTFIVAPAVLTNASTVMGLQTANRFARAIDRARSLAELVKGRESDPEPEIALRVRQIIFAERRVLLLVRALTAFYLAVGAFAAASLAALLGAAFAILGQDVLRQVALWVAMAGGVTGVGGLIAGAALLVRETRHALAILTEETAFIRKRRNPAGGTPKDDVTSN
jgi:hypothetical protein